MPLHVYLILSGSGDKISVQAVVAVDADEALKNAPGMAFVVDSCAVKPGESVHTEISFPCEKT
jgi:hypothetical protein